MTDRCCLSYWFPKLLAAGLPVPDTRIVPACADLDMILDGKTPPGFAEFIDRLTLAVTEIGGAPCFLRTGQFSDKWHWKDTCYLADVDLLPHHVANLIEASALVDIMGLRTDVWVVRKLIPTTPLFHAFRGRMPITREFRFFVRDGVIQHTQPYWPPGALEDENPDKDDWRGILAAASVMGEDEENLRRHAGNAGIVLGGFWSVDLLQDASGDWWITDCAEGERSYRYDPNDPPKPRAKYTGNNLMPDEDEL